jgi:tetratricopeptide (TPR) repeat protein
MDHTNFATHGSRRSARARRCRPVAGVALWLLSVAGAPAALLAAETPAAEKPAAQKPADKPAAESPASKPPAPPAAADQAQPVPSKSPVSTGVEKDAAMPELEGQPAKERVRLLRMKIDEGHPTKELYFQLGNAYYENGDLPGATSSFSKAIEMDPKYFKATVNLALMYDEQEKWTQALETFEQAAKLDPNNPDVWSHMGNTYYSQGQYGKATELYRKALKMKPDATHALYSMGVAFADAGIFREAVRYWSRVSQLEPDSDLGKAAKDNLELLQKYLVPR